MTNPANYSRTSTGIGSPNPDVWMTNDDGPHTPATHGDRIPNFLLHGYRCQSRRRRALATYPPEAIEQKTSEYFQDAGGTSRTGCGNSEFPWNVQQRIIKKGLDIAIEPNETSHDNVTFIVPEYCIAVQIRLFIPTKDEAQMGWTAVIYHDIKPPWQEKI